MSKKNSWGRKDMKTKNKKLKNRKGSCEFEGAIQKNEKFELIDRVGQSIFL